MHLAVHAGDCSIGVQRHRRVVIKSRRSALEKRSDNRNASLASNLGQLCSRWPWNGFGKIEQTYFFPLAKVLRAKKLRQANYVRAQPCRLADMLDSGCEIGFGVRAHAHLHQAHNVFAFLAHDCRPVLLNSS